jgi:HlyD family secretion protein
MRMLVATAICIVLLPAAISNPEGIKLPTVSTDTVVLRKVHESRDTLLVERPVDAREHTMSSAFVVDEDSMELRRVAVTYGRVSSSLIQIMSGVSPGQRIVVSDMRAWDAFERIRLRPR